VAEDDTAAAALVPSCAPGCVNHAPSIREDAGVAVGIYIVARARIASRRQAEALDMAASEANSKQWLSRVSSLSEELRGEREGAEILKHDGQWMGTSVEGCR